MDILNNPEIIDAVVQLVTAGGVGLAALIYRKAFNTELDAKAQATLHSALSTGAHMAWSRFFGADTVAGRDAMMKVTLEHVLGEGAGDSVKRLGVTPDGLMKLAEAKLMEVGAKFQTPKQEGAS